MLASDDNQYIDHMLDKYEHFIELNFEPDVPLHRSRPHSYLHNNTVQYSDNILQSDPIGWYKRDVLVTGEPTAAGFYEEYPHMVGAWVYTDMFGNDEFDYSEEKQYIPSGDMEEVKKQLDDASK